MRSAKKLRNKDLEKLKFRINEILGHKFLKVLKVEDGCLQVTFRAFTSNEFVISDKQHAVLSSLGVISVSCGSESVLIRSSLEKKLKADSGKS